MTVVPGFSRSWAESLKVPILFSLLAFSVYAHAAVDPWAQLIIHLSLSFLLLIIFLTNPLTFHYMRERNIWYWWGGWLACLAISTHYSEAPTRSLEQFWNALDIVILFILVSTFTDSEIEDWKRYILWLFLCLSLASIREFSLTQHPPSATLLNPNALAGYLLMAFFISLDSMSTTQSKLFAGSIALLSMLSLCLTQSIGGFIALLAAILCSIARFKPTQLRTGYGSTVCAALLALIGWKISIHWDAHRWGWWLSAFQMARVHPFFGLGPGTYEIAAPHLSALDLFSLYAHNTYIQWLAEWGILPFILILSILLICIKTQRRPFLFTATIAFIIHNFVDYSFYLPAHALLFWTVQAQTWQKSFNPREKQDSFRTIGLLWRGGAVLIFIAYGMVLIRHFRANQCNAEALYMLQQKDYVSSHLLAEKALHNNPSLADAYEVLLDVQLSHKFLTRGMIDQAIVYTLFASEREPINPRYTLIAFHLCQIIGAHDLENKLTERFISKYFYFYDDKRFLRQNHEF